MKIVHIGAFWNLSVYPGFKQEFIAHGCTANLAIHFHHVDFAFRQRTGNFADYSQSIGTQNSKSDGFGSVSDKIIRGGRDPHAQTA